MRYAVQTLLSATLLWVAVACQSGPSQQFIQKVSGELNDLKAASDQGKSMSEKVTAFNTTLETLKAELGKNWEKVEKDKELSAQYTALGQQIGAMESEINTAAGEIQSAVSEAQAFVDGLAQQKKGDQDLEKEWATIREKVTAASGKLTELGAKVSGMEAEVSKYVEAVKSKFAQAKK